MTQRILQQTTVAGQRPVLDNEIAMATICVEDFFCCVLERGKLGVRPDSSSACWDVSFAVCFEVASIWEKWGSKIMCCKANSHRCMLPVFPLFSAVWGFNSSIPDTLLQTHCNKVMSRWKKWIYMQEELGPAGYLTEACRLLFVQSIVHTCSCVALRLLLTA